MTLYFYFMHFWKLIKSSEKRHNSVASVYFHITCCIQTVKRDSVHLRWRDAILNPKYCCRYSSLTFDLPVMVEWSTMVTVSGFRQNLFNIILHWWDPELCCRCLLTDTRRIYFLFVFAMNGFKAWTYQCSAICVSLVLIYSYQADGKVKESLIICQQKIVIQF